MVPVQLRRQWSGRPARVLALLALSGMLALVGCSSQAEPGPVTPEPTAPAAPTDIRTGRVANEQFTVTPADLGMHSYTTKPEVPTGALRMTCSPTWATTNPAKGTFDWADFDMLLTRAEQWGYTDILYSFCATPEWAGQPVKGEDLGAFGPGTAQAPKDMADWDAFVKAVAERYKGRISGYEVWNEPSSTQFFTGTPAELAEMTERAYGIIKAADPDAFVLSASTQTHRMDLYEPFFADYVSGLAQRDWPVDGFSVHFYPDGEGDPNDRVRNIQMVQAELADQNAPEDLPLWDTEVNYGVGLAGGEPDGRITGKQAAAWTAQTFLDGWRSGVRRTYWYLWSADYYGFPGIQMRQGDPSTAALNTLGQWVIGSQFNGCKEDLLADGTIVCSFAGSDGPFQVAWATRGKASIDVDPGTTVCPVFGGECAPAGNGRVTLDQMPVKIG